MRAILECIGRDVFRERIDVGDWHCAFVGPSGRSRVVGNVLHPSRLYTPVDIPEDAIAVATGRNHTCMVRPNLDSVCSGAHGHGQCAIPQAGRKVLAVAAGECHTAVVTVAAGCCASAGTIAGNVRWAGAYKMLYTLQPKQTAPLL